MQNKTYIYDERKRCYVPAPAMCVPVSVAFWRVWQRQCGATVSVVGLFVILLMLAWFALLALNGAVSGTGKGPGGGHNALPSISDLAR